MKVWKVVTFNKFPVVYEHTCIKATEKSIFFEDRRTPRACYYGVFFDDYKSAMEYAIDYAKKSIERNKRAILQAQEQIKGLEYFIEKNEGAKDGI